MAEQKTSIKSFNSLIPYLFKYKWGYLYGFTLLVIINALAAYIPQLIKKSITLLEAINADSSSQLNSLVLTIVALAVFMALFRTISRRTVFGIGRSVEYDLKKTLFNHLVTMQPDFFTKQKTGDLISIITNDVQSLRALAGFAMLNIANTIIAFSIIIPLMVDLNAKLTYYFLSLIPLVLIFITLISRKLKRYQELVLTKLGELSNFIEQNLSGIHIIKTYGQEESETKRFSLVNQDLLGNYLKLIKYRSLVGPTMKLIASIGFILLLYIGGASVIDKTFSLGEFAAYSLYIERLIWPVATLGWLVTVVYRAIVSSERIDRVLSTEPRIRDNENSINKENFDDAIDLKSLNCKITKGSMVGIVGTIGSGKTTLANKIMHLTELQEGEILIDDLDVKNIKLKSLRTLVNLVPQENFLFSASIKENIAYAKDLNDAEIMNLAQKVSIHDEIMNFPKQYDTEIGERGVTLSGGQRQRLAIARALAIDPEILILDDALSSVDNTTAAEIFKNIREQRVGKTTIFITHKIHAIKDSDQIIAMDQMKIVESGKHEELMNLGSGVYKMLWESQDD